VGSANGQFLICDPDQIAGDTEFHAVRATPRRSYREPLRMLTE
jgi:hypothetical protein